MTLISFAQNQEDVMLWRALGHVRNGFYIDVGAADPVDLSVTKLFYDRGWHGINLEPQPAYFASLRAARPHDINLQLAAGRKAASHTLYSIDDSGLSTLDAEIAARHQTAGWKITEEAIEALPLADICEKYRPHGPIHFLKIDVEGAEGDVLAGADLRRFRPWIVLLEATLPNSQEESYADWEPILTSQGYTFVWFDGLNRFYLADEMKDELGRHFHVQPNVFDAFQAPVHLLRRAERAEQELQHFREQARQDSQHVREQAAQEILHVREQAAESLRDADTTSRQAAAAVEQFARETDSANHRLAEAMQQMERMAHTLNDTIRQNHSALVEQTQRGNEALHAAHVAHLAARQAGEQVTAMLNSTSWRVTAPLRMVRRMLPTKQLARQVFHRGVKLLMALPGGQGSVRFVRAVAPGPVEWLARRYRVYEEAAAIQHHAFLNVVASPAASMPDLSAEEVRLYQQMITTNPAGTAPV